MHAFGTMRLRLIFHTKHQTPSNKTHGKQETLRESAGRKGCFIRKAVRVCDTDSESEDRARSSECERATVSATHSLS